MYNKSINTNLPNIKMAIRETVTRIMKDIREIVTEPLTSNGVYYCHDEEDILKGYAMIEGPKDTPYFGGFYFFELTFPSNYPYIPPTVIFKTNNGRTRFNPNLYVNGKVCLSILNTWDGEPWSPCNTISSTLLAILTVFNKNPLLNEPGITIVNNKNEIDEYNRGIKYENIRFSICTMMKNINSEGYLSKYFVEEMKEIFSKNFTQLIKIIEKEKSHMGCDDPIFIEKYRIGIAPEYETLIPLLTKINSTIAK